MVKLSACVLVLMVAACAPTTVTPETVDARAVLPGDLDRRHYVRHYLLTTVASDEDLPFTTTHSFVLPEPRRVWVGAYARTPGFWTGTAPGIRVVERREEFPEFVHGGCGVVNVVADAYTGETLASWCNVDGGPPENGMPHRTPTYIPDGSPFRETQSAATRISRGL